MTEHRSFLRRVTDWIVGAQAEEPLPALTEPPTQIAATPSFAVIDVETTGLSPRQHRILELAVVRVSSSGAVVDEWTTRFNPEGPVGATRIHGIRDADVRQAPLFRHLAADVLSRISGLPVVAHNARFDLAFLRAEFDGAGTELPFLDAICTLEASHRYLPDLTRRRLADCCAAANVQLHAAHSALGDARATAGLLSHFLQLTGGDASLLQSAPSQRGHRIAAAARSKPVRLTQPRPKQRPLLHQLHTPTLLDLVEEGAPASVSTYLEALLEALEDGALSADERDTLAELAELYELSALDLRAAHHALLLAAAHRAVADGRVSRDETAQLRQLAALLDEPEEIVKSALEAADAEREATIAATLRPLPVDWALGQPLRMGDGIAFTGCDERWRERMEIRSAKLGVRVTSSVSGRTHLLVSDGSYAGTKLESARRNGTRIVDPRTFEALIDNLQPRATADSREAPVIDRGPAPAMSPAASEDREATALARPHPRDVRAWARAQGIAIGDRGRIPARVVAAYRNAR